MGVGGPSLSFCESGSWGRKDLRAHADHHLFPGTKEKREAQRGEGLVQGHTAQQEHSRNEDQGFLPLCSSHSIPINPQEQNGWLSPYWAGGRGFESLSRAKFWDRQPACLLCVLGVCEVSLSRQHASGTVRGWSHPRLCPSQNCPAPVVRI